MRQIGLFKGVMISLVLVVLLFVHSPLLSIDFFALKDSIINNSWKKIGFVYVQPAVMVQNAGYSSNIFSYNDIVRPDYRADLGFNVTLSAFLGKRFIISIEENPFYTFYAENKDQEYFNNILRGNIHTWFGRFNLTYSYSYENVKRQPSSEFGADVISNVTGHSIALDYGRHDILFVTMFYNDRSVRFSEKNYFGDIDLSQRLDRNESVWGGQLNKVIFTRTIIYLKGERYRFRYNFEDIKDGTGTRLSIGIKFPEIGPVEGDFSVGMNYFVPGDTAASKYNRIIGRGKVSVRPVRSLRLRVGYVLDNTYSFWSESAYFVEEGYNGAIDYYIGKRLRAGLEYNTGTNTYYFVNGDPAGRIDSSSTRSITLGYRLSGKFGIGLYYSRFSLSTDVIEFSRSYNFIGGYFTHDF